MTMPVNGERGVTDMIIEKELALLRHMTVGDLRERYAEVTGEQSRSANKHYLVRRIAWHLQATAEGGLSERARQRARELADESFLRTRSPAHSDLSTAVACKLNGRLPKSPDTRLPMAGALLTRQYCGGSITVKVLGNGFLYEGDVYRSLTAVAKAVTGSHWNGFDFFGLREPKR